MKKYFKCVKIFSGDYFMKKLSCLILILIMVFSLAGCDKYEGFYYSLDGVEDFYYISKTEDKSFYNVTPEGLSEEINLQIFKNNEKGESFILNGRETYKICEGGSYGFIDAEICDYDKDDKNDLLISFNDKDGAKLVVFDTQKKIFKGETLVDDDGAYLIKIEKKFSSGNSLLSVKFEGFSYNLYEIEVKNNKSFAKLKYKTEEKAGEIEITQKGPVFKGAE